jgi:hypothetical protein
LNFRKHVLKQNPSDGLEDVYRFSKSENGKRKDLTTEELTTNVKKACGSCLYNYSRK